MKPKTSPIWNYFVEIDESKARCQLCDKVYSRKGRTTTALKSHLKAIHAEEYEDFEKLDRAVKLSSETQKEKNKEREAGTTYFISMGPSQSDDQDSAQDLQTEDPRKVQTDKRKKPAKDTSQETYNKKEKNSEIQGRDEYTTYGELVAMKLRKIGNNYARSTAQYHINNILYKAEIGAYDQQQNKPNSFQTRENIGTAPTKSSTRHDKNSQISSSASNSMDDLLKLESEDSDE